MDNVASEGDDLTNALQDLRIVNGWLGGYSTSIFALAPYIKAAGIHPVHILDVGCGGGDFAEALLLWARRTLPAANIFVTAVDFNPAAVKFAREQCDTRMAPDLAERIVFMCGEAFSMNFADNSFDIAHASLFTHHFDSDHVVQLLREMTRLSSAGIVVNDLHRHPLALAGITLLSKLLKASPMVQHDGPLSVRRAFTKDELSRIGAAAGLRNYTLTWHWAFRWLLSTVPDQFGKRQIVPTFYPV
jgi:ubiquinone/menaquinone biosynthesis C-methylase UbiE